MSDPILKRADRTKEDPWTKVYNKFSQDTSISLDLRGLILYCISLPDNWEFHSSHLAKVNNIPIKRFYKLIEEGINAGYIAKEPIKKGNLNNGIRYRFSDDKDDIKNISPTQSKTALSEEKLEKQENTRKSTKFSNNFSDTAIFDASKNDTLQTIKNDRIEYTLRNEPTPCRLSKSSISTVHFFPEGYKLMNGEPLSLRTQRALNKYKGDDYIKLCANVKAYEEYCKQGYEIKNHEKTLQWCIKIDLSAKNGYSMRNLFYAKYKFEEAGYAIHLKCYKTMIKIEDKFGTISTIELSQHEESFKEAVLHLLRKIKDQYNYS